MARSAVNYTYEADLAFAAPGSNPGVAFSGAVDPTALAVTDNNQFKTATGLDLEALDKMVNAREGDQKNKLGGEKYDVVVVLSAAVVGGGETYDFTVYVGAAGDGVGGTPVGTLSFAADAAVPGQYVIALDAATIENLDADREEIALGLVAGGVASEATFTAWLAYGSKAA